MAIRSPGRATGFYTGIGGLEAETFMPGDGRSVAADYRLLKDGETLRFGMMPNPVDDLDPVWVSYLRVESPRNIAAQVAALGGTILIDARPRPLGGEVAVVAGPSGAGIGLQTWPLQPESQELSQ